MTQSSQLQNRLKEWWNKDSYRRWLLMGGVAYALFFSQGIPLWDDDFTSWFWKIKDHGILHYVWNWIWPISTQPQYWGFNERPLQELFYKFCYLISGYESWSYFLFKSLTYGSIGVMIYLWALRLLPDTQLGQKSAFAAALFFLLAPCPMAAHIMQQDFAPQAELLFLVITYLLWAEIEKTPLSWQGLPKLDQKEQQAWVLRWLGLAFVTYLAYKSKADLKLIPVILALYVLLVRRKQIGFFAIPVAAMVFLAIPWGPGIFTKLPPFVPGSKGSEIGWMWQPASLERMMEFIWASGGFDFIRSLKAPTISLAGLLGPFLLLAIVIFLGWKMEAFDKVPWTKMDAPADRARTFALIWFVVILLATSALPAINYIFRIRYGILPLVPASILLAWIFNLFAESKDRLPQWATYAAIFMFGLQASVNLNRSISYRRDMGQVMVAVDQVYDYVRQKYPNERLTLLPDFRPYDYRPDSAPAIKDKVWLSNTDDLAKQFEPYKTYAISWKPSLWDQLEMVEHFSGCRETSLFDRIFPCPSGTGSYLMRFIGSDPLYVRGEELRKNGDIAGAKKTHEQFLAKYPLDMGGQFVVGLEAFQLKDWAASERAYSMLEKFFPDHLSILYNHALALVELKSYDPAIERLRYVVAQEPSNYAALINLYYALMKNDQPKKAKDILLKMKTTFPNDNEVNRLLAGGQ